MHACQIYALTQWSKIYLSKSVDYLAWNGNRPHERPSSRQVTHFIKRKKKILLLLRNGYSKLSDEFVIPIM